MGVDQSYFDYLQTRSRLSLLYRTALLYPRLARQLRGRAVDVGCGIGDMVRFRPNTVGVDVNPLLVQFCQSQGLDVRVMPIDQLPFEANEFDSAILDNVIEHLTDPQPILREIRRVLRPKGRFVVGVPGELGYKSDADHKRFYDESTLVSTIQENGYCHARTLYSPLKWRTLSTRLRWYAIYGVFERCD